VEIKSYEQALAALHKIDGDAGRTEFIVLVSRGGETAVLRVKFN
jgi:serine protease Do